MHLPDESESSPQINIVPMIDVIFVVLTFFILSSLFLTRAEGLPVTLPRAATGESQLDQHTLTVTLTASGTLQLGNAETTLESLPTQIEARRVGTQSLLIVIQADEAVPHGQVVAVMDQLRTLGNIQLGIATAPLTTSAQP